MERLTFDGLFCDLAVCQEVPCKYPDTGCSQRQTWDKLKFIEDILGDDYDLDRLRELVEADRDGRIEIPPVAQGAIVYGLHIIAKDTYEIEECPVVMIQKKKNRTWNICVTRNTGAAWYSEREIGEDIYLTREAAEKALEEHNGQT